jgi:quinol monooxygenase YgiN
MGISPEIPNDACFPQHRWWSVMQVYNVVKFRVKPGEEDAFLDAHRNGRAKWLGLERGFIIKTGEQTFCLIGTWSSQEALIAARPAMIKTLNSFRSLLEDQGGGRGITDAVSGTVVLDL